MTYKIEDGKLIIRMSEEDFPKIRLLLSKYQLYYFLRKSDQIIVKIPSPPQGLLWEIKSLSKT